MIYYLVIEGSSSFIIKELDRVLVIQHAYDNFFLIKVNQLSNEQHYNLNNIGWTRYIP